MPDWSICIEKSVRRIWLVALWMMLGLLRCFSDAERDNPLDAKSPSYQAIGHIRGTVTRFYSPFEPIVGAQVNLRAAEWTTITGEEGNFTFQAAPIGKCMLRASRSGYAPDSTTVEVQVGQVAEATLRLDALPVFQSVSVVSSHISRWWPTDDLYFAELKAKAHDPDEPQTVIFVDVMVPDLGIVDSLIFDTADMQFEGVLNQDDFPNGNLQSLLGREIVFQARDRRLMQNSSGPIYLARIINETPVADTPQGLQTFVPPDTLQWQPMFLPFDFTYTVEVMRFDAGLSTAVWSRENISATDTIAVTGELPTGTYFWTVSVVDEFGNRSRSREASFLVP